MTAKLRLQTRLFLAFAGLVLLALLIVEVVGAASLTRHVIHHLTRMEGLPPELRDLSFWQTLQIMHPQERLLLYRLNATLLKAGALALLLSALVSLWVTRYLTRPLTDMRRVALRMAGGDFTERIADENPDELGDLARALNSLAASLERAEMLRRQMTADVAHELRTPLAGLRSYLEALRDGVLPADAVNLQAALEETLRLERLVEDLRELSLLEADGLSLEVGPVDLRSLVDRVLTLHGAEAERLGIDIASDLPAELPPARADPDRLAQVLHNLLANALTHTPRGGRVTVSASAETPPPRTAAGEAPPPASSGAAPSPRRFLTVTVTDTGLGIPAEALPYVFERFYRVDPSRGRETGGSGLGLTIARALVERMGGRIWVESEPGAGARFSFTVPAWTLKPASLGSDRSGGAG